MIRAAAHLTGPRPPGSRRPLAPSRAVWNALGVRSWLIPADSRRPCSQTALLLVLAAGFAAAGAPAHADSIAPGTFPDSLTETRGFEAPVALIPEVGLWVDGTAELGFAKKTGLVLWWNMEKAASAPQASRVDWSRVTFRIRAEAWDARGRRVDREEKLVGPLRLELQAEKDGFPMPLRLALKPGKYRIRLEAYPLISAQAAGLDSVPHGRAEAIANVPDLSHRSRGWSIGDPLFLDSIRRWEPGAPDERTWYEWVVRPNPSRTLSGHGTSGQLAFEVVRSDEPVPRCGSNTCRVVITVRDSAQGIVLQELRPVPAPATVSAYLVPIDASALSPGHYSVTIEVFEASEREAAIRREFSVSS